jgi:hypothetical protein
MTKNNHRPISTQTERLCEQCARRVAAPQDWLCSPCREALETIWLRLTTEQFRSFMPDREWPLESTHLPVS